MDKIKNKLNIVLIWILGVSLWGVLFLLPSVYAKTHGKMKMGKLTFGTEIRFRGESQNNFNTKYYGSHSPKRGGSDNFLLDRFRMGFDYRPSKVVHVALWVQDAREWGSKFHNCDFYNRNLQTEFSPYTDELELWNTYLEVKRPNHLPLGLKVGRQQIYYGDNRVFGPGQWGNTGRWMWDAVRVSYYFSKGFVDVYYGRTVIHEPVRFSLNHRHGFESIGTYTHIILPKSLASIGVESFAMTKRDYHRNYRGEDGKVGSLKAAYAGMRVFKNRFHGFDFDTTYVREFGDYSHDTIRAYGYHLLMAYTVPLYSYCPRVSVEYSVGSGDGNPRDSKHESFDGAFGARDKAYGRMNLFRWRNIRDAQINLELHPKKWMCLKAEFHNFWLDKKRDGWSMNPKLYRDKSGDSGDEVGKEFDLVYRFNLPRGNQIQVGYGHFWPNKFVKKVASCKQANWFFVQWQYKFSWKIF